MILKNNKIFPDSERNKDISSHTTLSDTCVGKNIGGFPSSTP